MLKNLGLLFFISLWIGNPSLAGGAFSTKNKKELWITIAKPADQYLNMWNRLSAAYQIKTITYENDIEFALPKGWQIILSKDKINSYVQNENGKPILLLQATKASPIAIFCKDNIELLLSEKASVALGR